ncbi:MAG TPA: hypothetical protein VIF15_18650 [Polyangiaceae bacterium]|jgi:hypothetical protein
MDKTIAAVLVGATTLAGLAQGCALPQDASKFREPIPQKGDVSLAMPGSQASGAAGQSASIRIQGGGTGGGGSTGFSTFYEFTRNISDGVDYGTAVIIGEIVAITSLPPTTVDDNHAVWGPGSGDALDPVTWKLVVTQVGDREFDYEVDGRSHLSTSDADWKAIVTGHGYGKSHPSHRSGWFQLDNDVFRSLDPMRGTSTGKVKVTFDARAYPLTIVADLTTNDGTGAYYDVAVTHEQDGSGVVALTALADISSTKDGVNENVVENSRWNATGAGRADVKMSGGDLGATTALASECWSSAYTRTYYTDNVNYQPTVGDASTCAFAQAQFASQ